MAEIHPQVNAVRLQAPAARSALQAPGLQGYRAVTQTTRAPPRREGWSLELRCSSRRHLIHPTLTTAQQRLTDTGGATSCSSTRAETTLLVRSRRPHRRITKPFFLRRPAGTVSKSLASPQGDHTPAPCRTTALILGGRMATAQYRAISPLSRH